MMPATSSAFFPLPTGLGSHEHEELIYSVVVWLTQSRLPQYAWQMNNVETSELLYVYSVLLQMCSKPQSYPSLYPTAMRDIRL